MRLGITNIFALSILAILYCSCNTTKSLGQLTSKVIVQEILSKGVFQDSIIYLIDSDLVFRQNFCLDTIKHKGKYCFDSDLDMGIPYKKLHTLKAKFIIPDSLKNHLKYKTSNDSLLNRRFTYYWASPLFHTKKKDEYILQLILVETWKDIPPNDWIVFRTANREYRRFYIKGKKVVELPSLKDDRGGEMFNIDSR